MNCEVAIIAFLDFFDSLSIYQQSDDIYFSGKISQVSVYLAHPLLP